MSERVAQHHEQHKLWRSVGGELHRLFAHQFVAGEHGNGGVYLSTWCGLYIGSPEAPVASGALVTIDPSEATCRRCNRHAPGDEVAA